MALERFLIVDSDDAIVLFFEMILQEIGIKPRRAITGDEGLEILKSEHIQFAIVAWEMKGMPGTVFIQKARAARARKYLPCLIYSKRMSEDDVLLTKELGFDDILPMPFDKAAAKQMLLDTIDAENNLHPIEANLRKIEGYVADARPQEGLKLINERLYKPSPFLCRAHTTTAEIWWKMGKLDRAMSSVKQALEANGNDLRAQQVHAKILSAEGQHDEAIAILKALTENSPKNISSKVNLGSAYVTADRHEEAKAVFQGILDLDPDQQDTKDEMAIMAFKEGDMSLAAQLVAETESGDEMVRIFNNMGIQQVADGAFDKGIDTYRNAINVLVDRAQTHLLLYNTGLAYKKKGDLHQAFACFCESYIQAPSYEKAYSSLALVAKDIKAAGDKPKPELVKKVKSARTAFKNQGTPPPIAAKAS